MAMENGQFRDNDGKADIAGVFTDHAANSDGP